MNRTELIAAVAANTGLSKKDSEKALTAALDAITAALQQGDKVSVSGFGTFEVKERAEHTGRNPRTLETIMIPASKAPVFKPAKALKDAVTE